MNINQLQIWPKRIICFYKESSKNGRSNEVKSSNTNPKGGRGDNFFFSNDHCTANDNNKLFKVSRLPEIES